MSKRLLRVLICTSSLSCAGCHYASLRDADLIPAASMQASSQTEAAIASNDAITPSAPIQLAGYSVDEAHASTTAYWSDDDDALAEGGQRPSEQPESSASDRFDSTALNNSFANAQPGMTLEQLEALAFVNNPSICELNAIAQQAAGYRTQVGLKANPLIGYQGQQLADAGTEQHLAFIQQEFVTGNKLQYNRRVQNEALRAQLFEYEAQRLRVGTDVRTAFYTALVAQQRAQVIADFEQVTDQGVNLAELRLKAGEGSRIDLLQSQVQRSEIELAEQQAALTFDAAWREMVAVIGVPSMSPQPLVGSLPTDAVNIDWDGLQANILASSPEYLAAQTRVCEAQMELARHEIQPIPNVQLQLGAGYDMGTDSGMMNVQVGAPIPVHNQNQGNIAAARANVRRAMHAEERIRNSILARLATTAQQYNTARAAVSMYREQIMPNANQSLELAEVAYKAGETDFLQVLVARRTFFDANLQLLEAQATLARAEALVDGYLLQGSLEATTNESGDSSLRDLTFGQQ